IEERLHAITDDLARGYKFAPHRPLYPGIHAFGADAAAIYFAREQEPRAIIERLDARRIQGGPRLLLMIGASGSGQSSLLKACVLPQIARGQRHGSTLPLMRSERAPLEACAKAIAQRIETAAAWEDWHEKLKGPQAVDEIEQLVRKLRSGESSAA